MRSVKKIIRFCLPAVALCWAMVACDVAEDESDCAARIRLAFSFVKNGTEQFGPAVPSLSVFVFDESNTYVGCWSEEDNTLFGPDYTMPVSLTSGTYNFVVWGGMSDTHNYLCLPGQELNQVTAPVAGQTTMSEMILRSTCDTRNSYVSRKNFVDYVPEQLFYGQTGQLVIENNNAYTITVPLMKDSKTIHLTVIGLPEPKTRANPYYNMDIFLDSPNGCYDFWNGFEQNPAEFTWAQHNAASGGTNTQVSVFYTRRMIFGRKCLLSLYNTDTEKTIYTADILEDYIRLIPAYNAQDAVDAQDEFDILIDARSSLGVSVTVNGWNIGLSGSIIQ